MMIVFISTAVLFLCLIVALLIVFKQQKKIEALRMRANQSALIADKAEEILNGFRQSVALNEQSYEIIPAYYFTSESDMRKYSSEEKMRSAIRTKLAMIIGNDIAKKFEPSVLKVDKGKEKYSLVLKVKKI